MSSKIVLSLVAVIAMLCLPAFAQPGDQDTAGQPASATDASGLEPVTRAEFNRLSQVVEANSANANFMSSTLDQMANQVAENARSLRSVQDRLEALAQVQQNNLTQLSQITQMDSSGNAFWRFDASNQAAVDELQRALETTVPAEGSLVIRNRMNSDQHVVVNGQQQFVAAGATLTVSVPPGTVSTRLPGQQEVTWNVGFPDYEQRISIRPDQSSPLRQVVGYRSTSDGATTTTTYYAPATTTAYYTPQTTNYTPTTAYYTPTTTYYSPTTTYYAPTTSYYTPTTSYYTPTSYSTYYPYYYTYYPTYRNRWWRWW